MKPYRILIYLNVIVDVFILCSLFLTLTAHAQQPCMMSNKGDADCNGVINLVDYEILRRKTATIVQPARPLTNEDAVFDIVQYEIKRRILTVPSSSIPQIHNKKKSSSINSIYRQNTTVLWYNDS